MSNYPESKPTREAVYTWPIGMPPLDEADEVDRAFYPWAAAVREELKPVYKSMSELLPDDPVLLDEKITNEIEGWLSRVSSLMVTADWWLNKAKGIKWPSKFITNDGKPATEGDRNSIYYDRLADFRFVRDSLEALLNAMINRIKWSQSARKSNNDANIGYSR